jgi:hypothetical protein
VGLETLMVMAYSMKVRETAFAVTHALFLPALPRTEFSPGLPTIKCIRRECGWAPPF